MSLLRLLVRMSAPARVYVDQHWLDPEDGQHLTYRRSTSYGPGCPGWLVAVDDEYAELAEEFVRHRNGYEATLADAKRRWTPQPS
ncbi:hypothetical protein [Blastococcus saxobsidens]|uniref:Uncharacterized protein n=1 Tax=Blastococcus saxobsidens (strain DD2) TaxID=1146883 RepID=H6RQZ7_BLASD|nr:hypothetical protein [Blastococcus saxobsidens]CCG02876.1 protein of unknown function [Blastococcus saxobsidens DD2]